MMKARSGTGFAPILGATAYEKALPLLEVTIMPSWSKKRERQYEHIKKSSKERGVPDERAKEIAARTVNKTRRQKRETPQKTTQGTGNPNVSLKDRKKDELYNIAQDLGIQGRSKMDKKQLVKAIQANR